MANGNQGMTEQEKYHYDEYCRLAEEARALYNTWDKALVPAKIKRPYYIQAAKLRRQADAHKLAFILLGEPDA